MPIKSSERSPRRFDVRFSATTPGSLLGRSSENAVLSFSCHASPAAAAPTSSATTRTATGRRATKAWYRLILLWLGGTMRRVKISGISPFVRAIVVGAVSKFHRAVRSPAGPSDGDRALAMTCALDWRLHDRPAWRL